jgi:hypothetical protein
MYPRFLTDMALSDNREPDEDLTETEETDEAVETERRSCGHASAANEGDSEEGGGEDERTWSLSGIMSVEDTPVPLSGVWQTRYVSMIGCWSSPNVCVVDWSTDGSGEVMVAWSMTEEVDSCTSFGWRV